jgi:hypothetical protein
MLYFKFPTKLPITSRKRITLVFSKLTLGFHEEISIFEEKIQSAGIANLLTGDPLAGIFGDF